MSLTVLNVAYPFVPVSPDTVGGAEQIVARLDRALARAGHRSLVVACAGSQVEGELIGLEPPPARLTPEVRSRLQRQCAARCVQRAIEQTDVDVVHVHGVDFLAYLPPPGVPVLATLHLPPAWYAEEVFNLERPDTWLNCVSHSQQADCPQGDTPLLPVVRNGVPLEQFEFRRRKRPFVLALGRICPEKGFHLALEAARACDLRMALGGEVFGYAEHQQYFEREIVPRLDGRRRFLGSVAMPRKARLLAAAQCLVVPSLVRETSSLVTMEALASGTPVVAFQHGAVKELVEHGRTGFLVADASELPAAIKWTAALDPQDCRRAAELHCSAERMCERYLDLYQRIVRGATGTLARAGAHDAPGS